MFYILSVNVSNVKFAPNPIFSNKKSFTYLILSKQSPYFYINKNKKHKKQNNQIQTTGQSQQKPPSVKSNNADVSERNIGFITFY